MQMFYINGFTQDETHFINIFILTHSIKAKMQPIKVINNTDQQQFEVHMDDYVAVLIYRFYKDDIALMHTEVPASVGKQRHSFCIGKICVWMGKGTQ
jgi:hypothetical protein